jgi:hypothetical protein
MEVCGHVRSHAVILVERLRAAAQVLACWGTNATEDQDSGGLPAIRGIGDVNDVCAFGKTPAARDGCGPGLRPRVCGRARQNLLPDFFDDHGPIPLRRLQNGRDTLRLAIAAGFYVPMI